MLVFFMFLMYLPFFFRRIFLILFITPVYNFIINRLADESAVLKPLLAEQHARLLGGQAVLDLR